MVVVVVVVVVVVNRPDHLFHSFSCLFLIVLCLPSQWAVAGAAAPLHHRRTDVWNVLAAAGALH